jgi:hypothetical protein
MSMELPGPNSASYQSERDDLTKVLALMDEYLAKLRNAQRVLESGDLNRSFYGLFAFLWLFGFGIGLVWALVSKQDPALIGLFTVSLAFGVPAFLMLVVQRSQRDRRFKRELQVTEKLLERLIRLASQAAEHQKLDMTQRLELELRLAETESALEQASSRTAPELTTLVRDAIHQVSKV